MASIFTIVTVLGLVGEKASMKTLATAVVSYRPLARLMQERQRALPLRSLAVAGRKAFILPIKNAAID